jgi:hypothetical protein
MSESMRVDNILIQPIDASDDKFFVIMNESSNAEITVSKAQLYRIAMAIETLLDGGNHLA